MSGTIGLIDSGIGGLTTLCQCIRAYPNKDYLYIADTKYAPYGNKDSPFLLQRANFLVEKLKALGAKVVIFACNSCSSSTVEQGVFSLPIIRVLPPIEKALSETTGKVLLLATPVTIKSSFIDSFSDNRLTKIANGELASLIERCAPNFTRLRGYLQDLLLPYSSCEGVILGCTHYLFLEDLIAEILPHTKIYTSNNQVLLELSKINLGISYCRRKIIITGDGDKQHHYSLLNHLLND